MAGDSRKFQWRGTHLYYADRRVPFSIVQDVAYPNMWRVKLPDGRLTDMVNYTRAKDAAVAYGLRYLNE